jgi:CheY-like chemotaxis protein
VIADGREGLDEALSDDYDLMVLDIGLPGMDGYAVCRAFREDELLRDMPIIAQTGWGQSHDKSAASDAGFNHHLTKPVSLDDLQAILAGI